MYEAEHILRDILVGKKDEKIIGSLNPVSSISSNCFHLQLLKSIEKLQGSSVGWRIQPF